MYRDRVRLPSLLDKVMSAAEAADLIQDGMTVGMSGFTRAGEAKAVPQALAMRAKERPLRISLMTGASLGNDLDKQLTEAGVLARRMPFQVDSTLRKAINAGEVMFIDQHLSETVEQLRNHQLKLPDIAVIEAAAITEQGHIVPTTSVGNSASFAIFAERVIVEINLAHNPNLEGLHDIYIPTYRPTRTPIPLVRADQRIGSGAIPIPADKIAAIVITEQADSYSTVTPPDAETQAIADHLIVMIYTDRPGIVAVYGKEFGDASINIAGMQIARQSAGGQALSVLTVDSPVPDELLATVATAIDATLLREIDIVEP